MIHLLRMPADIFLSTLLGRKSRKLVKGRNVPLSTEAPGVGLYDLWRSLLSLQSVAGGGGGGHGASWAQQHLSSSQLSSWGGRRTAPRCWSLKVHTVKLSEWPLALLAQPETHIPKPFLDVVCELTQTGGLGTAGKFACTDCVRVGRNSMAYTGKQFQLL